nr:MAG TPA: hypothetical protein [Caudoviricetes sp.]
MKNKFYILFRWGSKYFYFSRYPGAIRMLKKKAKKTRFQLFYKKIPENEKIF